MRNALVIKSKQTFIRKMVNRNHSYKSKETRVVTYVCRYSRGHLIPKIQSHLGKLGIECPLYRISAGVIDHPCFLTFITINPFDY